jgi:hypothetical protein
MKIQAKHGCVQFRPPKAQLQNWRVGLVLRSPLLHGVSVGWCGELSLFRRSNMPNVRTPHPRENRGLPCITSPSRQQGFFGTERMEAVSLAGESDWCFEINR